MPSQKMTRRPQSPLSQNAPLKHSTHALLDQVTLLAETEHNELLLGTTFDPVFAQHAQCQRVEVANRNRRRLAEAERALDATAHFFCGLDGECKCEEIGRRYAATLQKVHQTRGKCQRLARAGGGTDKTCKRINQKRKSRESTAAEETEKVKKMKKLN